MKTVYDVRHEMAVFEVIYEAVMDLEPERRKAVVEAALKLAGEEPRVAEKDNSSEGT